MKITLIGQNFDENSGQGVYEFSNYLYTHLKRINKEIKMIQTGNSGNPFMALFNNIFVSFFKTCAKSSEIYHFMMPEVSFPCLFKRPSIVTIHDIIPLITEERNKLFNIYFKFMMKIAKKANHLIAISDSTKKDLIRILKVPESKISVIYEGVDPKKFYPIKREKGKQFVIGYLGGLGKRKNIDYILDVAKKLEENEKIFFKIAGRGPELDRLVKLKEKKNLKNVEFFGFVPDKELNKFYNSLDLFIFPSYYEGFGLPVVEAMASGIPIMVSNRGSLIEISKDSGILINPDDPKNAVAEIEKIVRNPKLQKELKIKSIKKAKEFDWNKTAKETFKIYGRLKKK